MVYRYTKEEADLMQKRINSRLDTFQRNSGRGLPAKTVQVMERGQGIKLNEDGEPVLKPTPVPLAAPKKATPKFKSSGLEAAVAQALEKGERVMPSKPKRRAAKTDKRAATVLKALPVPKEFEECVSLWSWAQLQKWNGRPISEILIMIPNGAFLGGSDSKARAVVARKLKETGFQPGVYDYIVPVPILRQAGYAPGLWLEIKRTRGPGESTEQRAFARRMRAYGWRCEVAKGWVEASRIIEEHLTECD
jgi:hypothetical protein